MSRYKDPNTTDSKKHILTSEEDSAECFEITAIILSILVVILTFPFAILFCIRIVAEYERAVVFRLGRLRKGGARGPGVVFVLPCIDDASIMDLRTASFDVAPQEILTKDAVTIKVDAVVYFRLQDPLSAVIQVLNYRESTMLLGQTTLRNVAGTRMLNELLTEKDDISHTMQKILDEATDPWGVKVERVEIRDVRLPEALQRAMAAEAEANREARAKIVAADGEKNAAEALREAAEIISQSPSALQLRYLQTLATISAERNSTIIFPFPIEMFTGFPQRQN
ncbi:band 7 protein AGAP004871-like [Eupeodes corollae]|uniref:band 7 protein AGAP004871-like n=1 Tax=Eupeodes corollae TaxID=290404 RepID=UPI0024915A03|nr:band 7 protein AGAP004871-like [Eupeodes corollae]